jgi:hypothetical protein
MTENNAAQAAIKAVPSTIWWHPDGYTVNNNFSGEDLILRSAALDALSELRAKGVQAGDERTAFEAAMQMRGQNVERWPAPHGGYRSSSTEMAWYAWSDRAALASAPVAELPKIEPEPRTDSETMRNAWYDKVRELLSHLSDVLPDEVFSRIDIKTWNDASALIGAHDVKYPPQADKEGGDCVKGGAVAGLPDIEPEPRTATDYPVTLGGYSAHVAADRHSCACCGDPRNKCDCTSGSGEAMQLAESLRDWHGKGDGVTTAIPDELAQALYGYLYDAAGDPIRALMAKHAVLLEGSDYAYFELARTRATGWMAWLCSHPAETHADRKVLAHGQGSTPDEACLQALADFDRRAKGE